MTGRIGLYTSGLWRLRREVESLTGLHPVRRVLSARGIEAVGGWGFKPSARLARGIARRHGLRYIAIEDGFLRSHRPGAAEAALSYVTDDQGIHYDAAGPSMMEALVLARARDPARAAVDAALPIAAIRELGLSKYNLFDEDDRAAFLADARNHGAVLVIDQTHNDAAVAGAGADETTFRAMLIAAAEENPGCRILLKTHPETQTGLRQGYLDAGLIGQASALSPAFGMARQAGLIVPLLGRVAPIDLARRVRRVYAVSSQLGFEMLMSGIPTTVFGQAFYAGWGLTDDRAASTGRRAPVPLGCLVAAAFLDYARYFSPIDRSPCDIGPVIDHLARFAPRRVS